MMEFIKNTRLMHPDTSIFKQNTDAQSISDKISQLIAKYFPTMLQLRNSWRFLHTNVIYVFGTDKHRWFLEILSQSGLAFEIFILQIRKKQIFRSQNNEAVQFKSRSNMNSIS